MILTSAPLAMASTTGSAEVPARSIAPDAEARSDPTPPSKRTNSTVRFSSLKYPKASATYGVRWTTLGGVTGTAIVIFFAAQVAFGVVDADAAAVVGVGLAPLPPPHAANKIARMRPIAPEPRACIFELLLIALALATARYDPRATAQSPSSGCPSSRRR